MAELVKDEGNSSNKNLQKSPETEPDEEVEETDENISTEERQTISLTFHVATSTYPTLLQRPPRAPNSYYNCCLLILRKMVAGVSLVPS